MVALRTADSVFGFRNQVARGYMTRETFNRTKSRRLGEYQTFGDYAAMCISTGEMVWQGDLLVFTPVCIMKVLFTREDFRTLQKGDEVVLKRGCMPEVDQTQVVIFDRHIMDGFVTTDGVTVDLRIASGRVVKTGIRR